MSVAELIDEAQAAHVAAHGDRCGVVLGSVSPFDPCAQIRRAWAALHPRESDAAQSGFYRDRHREACHAAGRAYYAAHSEERRGRCRADKRVYREQHREEINERRRAQRRAAKRMECAA
jgi:hypothetical protein